MDNQYYPTYPAPPKTCASAIVSFVTGLVSILFAWASLFAIIGVIAGIISIVFYVKANKEIQATRKGGQGLAIAGLVCGIIGLIIGLIVFVCSLVVVITASRALNSLNGMNPLRSYFRR